MSHAKSPRSIVSRGFFASARRKFPLLLVFPKVSVILIHMTDQKPLTKDDSTTPCRLCGGPTIPPDPNRPEEEGHYCEACGDITK